MWTTTKCPPRLKGEELCQRSACHCCQSYHPSPFLPLQCRLYLPHNVSRCHWIFSTLADRADGGRLDVYCTYYAFFSFPYLKQLHGCVRTPLAGLNTLFSRCKWKCLVVCIAMLKKNLLCVLFFYYYCCQFIIFWVWFLWNQCSVRYGMTWSFRELHNGLQLCSQTSTPLPNPSLSHTSFAYCSLRPRGQGGSSLILTQKLMTNFWFWILHVSGQALMWKSQLACLLLGENVVRLVRVCLEKFSYAV